MVGNVLVKMDGYVTSFPNLPNQLFKKNER